MFGSDFPATTTAGSLAGVRGVNQIIKGTGLPEVSMDMVEGILNRNPLEILEIV